MLQNCGRVLFRTVVAGLHSRAYIPEDIQAEWNFSDFPPPPSYKNNNNSGFFSSIKNGSTQSDYKSSNSQPDTPLSYATKTRHKFLAVQSGFSKNMAGGASCVNEKNHYGDDACFIVSHHLADVVGVADGVGGWRQYGIDPSSFSRSLMQICASLVSSANFNPALPAQLLTIAYKQIWKLRNDSRRTSAKFPIAGSSTACVVILDKCTNQLHTANLGDSGFVVVRNGRIVHRSHEQTHYFNTPFQLALPPPSSSSHSPDFLSDSPESADVSSLDVQIGDIVLVATDGLFDNLPLDAIERELTNVKGPIEEAVLQRICNTIALEARRLSLDEDIMSPFAEKAREHGFHATGGKPDDITVVLILITADSGG